MAMQEFTADNSEIEHDDERSRSRFPGVTGIGFRQINAMRSTAARMSCQALARARPLFAQFCFEGEPVT